MIAKLVNYQGKYPQLACEQHSLRIQFPPDQRVPTGEVTIKQNKCSLVQDDVFRALNHYWQPFWQCAPEEDPTTYEETFHMTPPTGPALADNFEQSLDDWKRAIAQTKASSSPGVDGFSFAELKMLPDQILMHLVRIVSNLEFFPPSMMLARTVPIPKKGLMTADNSRPITILATLYRVWGKVCANRCLAHLGQHVSSAVTGMLPKRGAHDASYWMQMYLETQKFLGRHCTGLTLDLRKCFNLLCRDKVAQLMINFGLPPRLVYKWLYSIRFLARYWEISNHASPVQESNNGCPEGDTWSVIAMIVVSETWNQTLLRAVPGTMTVAYADNWSVWTTDAEISNQPVRITTAFVTWMHLQINWSKTWLWSTSVTGASLLQTCLSELITEEQLVSLTNATDLGCQMTYHGSARLGIILERLHDAKQRLDIIRNSDWNLPLKAHLIHVSVLPLALYGGELVAIGQKHLNTLRSHMADALVGEHVRSMSSSIFLHCADVKDMDPHIILVVNALRMAKKMLSGVHADTRNAFLKILSLPVETQGISAGPASALREYLQRLGLKCSKSGDIQVTSLRCCNLFTTPFKDLHRYLRWAWQDQLLMIHTQRTKLYNCLPIDKDAVTRALRRFPPKQRLLLLREIAGAFQTNEQKSKWDPSVQSHCDFCGELPDDRFHRAFCCPSFTEIRQSHAEHVDILVDECPDIVDLPVVHMHPHYEFHDALLCSMPEPCGVADMPSHCWKDLQRPTFYTDGSCRYPQSPATCFSAYAIVIDLCDSDERRSDLADVYKTQNVIPGTLQTIMVARTKGRQTIHRAEISALLWLCQNFSTFDASTDSATALHYIQLCRTVSAIGDLLMHDDADLLMPLFSALTDDMHFWKVKAHQEVKYIPNALLRYRALGNLVADAAANVACEKHLPEVVTQLEEFHADLQMQTDRLLGYFRLNLDLQVARAQANPGETVQIAADPPDSLQLFSDWQVLQAWKIPDTLQDSELLNCAWGIQWSCALLEWIYSCRWPLEAADNDPGISWAEIALCLILTQQQPLPVRRKRTGGEFLFLVSSQQALVDLDITFTEQATNAYAMFTQLQALIVEPVIPPTCSFRKVKSLYQQGSTSWSTGIWPRPQFAQQTMVSKVLHDYFRTDTSAMKNLPQISLEFSTEPLIEDLETLGRDWKERSRVASLAMRRVRSLRR